MNSSVCIVVDVDELKQMINELPDGTMLEIMIGEASVIDEL